MLKYINKCSINGLWASLLLNVSFAYAAVPLECVQLPSRVKACPNLVYRGIDDPETGKTKIFCFCKTDMVKLTAKNVSEEQRILNKMELRDLLAKYNYTEKQLFKLISN